MSSRDREPLSPEERDLARRLSQLGGHVAPPGSLDTKILAAARAAVQGRPRRTRPRWPFGVGIAASLAIAIGVAWQLRPLPEAEMLATPSETAPAARMIEPAAPSAAPAQVDDAADAPIAREAAATPPEAPAAALEIAAPAVERVQRAPPPPPTPETETEVPMLLDAPATARERDADTAARALTVPPPPAPPAPPAPTAPPAPATVAAPAPPPAPAAMPTAPTPQEAAAAKARTEERERQAQAASGTASMRAAGARGDNQALDRITATGSRIRPAEPVAADRIDDYLDEPLDDQPPVSFASPQARDAWLQRIRELVDEGERDAARASLREFRRRYPQHPVPADLKALLEE